MTIQASGQSKTSCWTMGRSSNVTLLYVARAARGLGDGFAVIILPAYLAALGFTPFEIGIVATSALLGTAVLTLAVGYLASRFDLRKLLLISAVTMIATGVAFSSVEYFPLVVIVAFLGTTNPSAGDIGVFVPLEHAMLARDAADQSRTQVFARYSLIGGLSSAAGALLATAPDQLVALGVDKVGALQLLFYVYAVLGLLATALYRMFGAEMQKSVRLRHSAHPAASSIGWPRCSAWMPLLEALLFSHSSPYGCSNVLISP